MRAAAAIALCGLTALVLPARARDTDGVLEGGGGLNCSARFELLRRRQHPPDQPHRPGVDQPQPPVVDGIKPSTRMTLQPQSS